MVSEEPAVSLVGVEVRLYVNGGFWFWDVKLCRFSDRGASILNCQTVRVSWDCLTIEGRGTVIVRNVENYSVTP